MRTAALRNRTLTLTEFPLQASPPRRSSLNRRAPQSFFAAKTVPAIASMRRLSESHSGTPDNPAEAPSPMESPSVVSGTSVAGGREAKKASPHQKAATNAGVSMAPAGASRRGVATTSLPASSGPAAALAQDISGQKSSTNVTAKPLVSGAVAHGAVRTRPAQEPASAASVTGDIEALVRATGKPWGLDDEECAQLREQAQFLPRFSGRGGGSFDDAQQALNSLQSNASALQRRVVELQQNPGQHPDNSVEERRREMVDGLERVGLDRETLVAKFAGKIIHFAGTKGKGSTVAITESILRRCGFRTATFTSPHLISVRERVRINGVPVSEEIFAEHFSRVWTALFSSRHAGAPRMPMYFRFLTILALELVAAMDVDVFLLECGVGGRADATNMLPPEVVAATAVTALGFDHMNVLGNTLPEIAGEKGGIFKAGVAAFTIPQREDAFAVLDACAAAVGQQLRVVAGDEALTEGEGADVPARPLAVCGAGELPALGLEGVHQRVNASLAVTLALHWLQKDSKRLAGLSPMPTVDALLSGESGLPAEFEDGLRSVSWPGRSQTIRVAPVAPGRRGDVVYHLDGAHTGESIRACGRWFVSKVSSLEDAKCVLVFNCANSRDPATLLGPLFRSSGFGVDWAIFTNNDTGTETVLVDRRNAAFQGASGDRTLWQDKCADAARSVLSDMREEPRSDEPATLGEVEIEVVLGLPAVRRRIEEFAEQHVDKEVHVLVAGSLYQVGAWLELLKEPVR